MLNCPNCSEKIESSWKVCPFCLIDLKGNCSNCGGALRPEWKACPQCGQPLSTEKGAQSDKSVNETHSLSPEQTLALFDHAQSAWLAEFQAPFSKFAEGDSPQEILSAIPSQLLDEMISTAAKNAAKEICDWLANNGIKLRRNPVATSADAAMCKRFSRVIRDLSIAAEALRNREIPTGTIAKMFRAVRTAKAESSNDWLYVIPKLGLLADAVQGVRSGWKLAEEDERYVDAYCNAVALLETELLDAVPEVLSLCLEDLAGDSVVLGMAVAEAKRRHEALNDLADKIATIEPDDSVQWAKYSHLTRMEVEQLPESPLANHLHGVVLHQMGLADEAIQYAWTAATKDEEAIGLWTNLAAYLVDAKRASEALEVGNYLSMKWPGDESATICAARCLSLNERFDEADSLLQELLSQTPDDADVLLFAVEVSVRKSDLREAATRFRKFAEKFLFSTRWLAENSTSQIFGPVISHEMLKGVYGSRGSAFDYSQAIKWFLSPHAPKDFFLPPSLPSNMLQGAAETFLKGVSPGEIVCFIDDTFWDTGKNGLALTKSSLRWKAMLGEVCTVKYSAINTIGMELDDATITFGTNNQSMELDCHSEAFAEGMYRFLTAAAFAFR